MKNKLMKKFGPYLGLAAFFSICAGFVLAPSSCSLTPDQGWVQSGDEITFQRGIAVVTSTDDRETKLFKLAEIGLDAALNRGLVRDGDTIKVDTPTQITITSPPELLPAPDPAVTSPLADSIAPDPAK